MYFYYNYNFKIFILLIYFNLLLRKNVISADGAKEIAQNFKYLEGLKEFKIGLG